jgi:putative restriction endonuclease
MFFSRQSGESYLWITVRMIVTTEVPQTATRIAVSNCYESPRPLEFGGVGMNWDSNGWKIQVNFIEMQNKVRPKDHMGVLRPVLPGRYSPLQTTGNGKQGV